MDISINVENYRLNVRAAGIIIHNNKLLIHRNINDDHYALIGGRVQAGEDSKTALKREIMEEMGKEITITGYVTTIENFFECKGENYHEIMFVYMAEFLNKEDQKIEDTIENVEGKKYLKYEWLNLDKIEEYLLKPEVMKEFFKIGKFPKHKINKD